MPSARIPIIYGGQMFGDVGTDARVHTIEEAQKFISIMLKHGQVGIDTSRIYADGTSEKVIGKLDLGAVRVDTKVYPVAPGGHSPEKIRESYHISQATLGPNVKIRVYYLHAPDRAMPFEKSLEAMDELYREGHFEYLGLSNYMSFEVAEIVGICERRGFVKPSVYEGVYNLLDRNIEAELFPCLRKFGIKFAAYTTLAGGYLTGKHLTASSADGTKATAEPGSHFDPNWAWSSFYHNRYLPTQPHVKSLQAVAEKHGLKLADGRNSWSEKGPLPQDVVDKCEDTWRNVKGGAHQYWL